MTLLPAQSSLYSCSFWLFCLLQCPDQSTCTQLCTDFGYVKRQHVPQAVSCQIEHPNEGIGQEKAESRSQKEVCHSPRRRLKLTHSCQGRGLCVRLKSIIVINSPHQLTISLLHLRWCWRNYKHTPTERSSLTCITRLRCSSNLTRIEIQRSNKNSPRLIELRRLRTTNQFQYVFVMDLGGALNLNCLIQERGSIFPTVYALWRHPELLPSFPTWVTL